MLTFVSVWNFSTVLYLTLNLIAVKVSVSSLIVLMLSGLNTYPTIKATLCYNFTLRWMQHYPESVIAHQHFLVTFSYYQTVLIKDSVHSNQEKTLPHLSLVVFFCADSFQDICRDFEASLTPLFSRDEWICSCGTEGGERLQIKKR